MEKRVIDRRLQQMSAEGTEFRTGVDVGVDITRRCSCAPSYDAVVLAGGATAVARPADPGPGADRHLPGDGVPAAGQPGAAGRPRRTRRSRRPGQAGGHHRRRRHRRRLPGHLAPAGRGLGAPVRDPGPAAAGAGRGQPVADLAVDLPDRLGARGGWRAGVRGEHRALPRRRARQRDRRCGRTRWSSSTAGSSRSRAATSSWNATWCCWRWASPGPSAAPLLDGLGRRADRPGHGRPRRRLRHQRRRGVRRRRHGPRAEPDRVGDRRGPLGGGRGRRAG